MTLSHGNAFVNGLNCEREKFGALALPVTLSVKTLSMLADDPGSWQRRHSRPGDSGNPNHTQKSPSMNWQLMDGDYLNDHVAWILLPSSQLVLRTEKEIGYMHRFYAFVVSSCKLIRS